MENKSYSDLVADKIRNYIYKNQLSIGSKLPNEFKLAELFDVSRSTIRESVKMLVSEQILEVKQGSGTYVKDLKAKLRLNDPIGLMDDNSENKALDFFEVRLIFEPEIASIAAQNASDEDCQNLIYICEEFKECIKNGENYLELDKKFHKQIAKCTGNSVIIKLMDIIIEGIPIFIKVTRNKFSDETLKFHDSICRAIISKDSIGAKCTMIEHLNMNRRYILENLDK